MDLIEIATALVVYALCTIAFLPGLALTLAYGGIYGTLAGGILALVGATMGATLATAIARRYLSRTMLAKLLSTPEPNEQEAVPEHIRRWRPLAQNLFELVDRYGIRTVVVTRLTPIVPFNLLNYLLGLTTLPIWQIAGLSFVCMSPACFVYAWIGASGVSAFTEKDPRYLLYILAGIALLLVVKPVSAYIIRHLLK